jgi:hypothetical protein
MHTSNSAETRSYKTQSSDLLILIGLIFVGVVIRLHFLWASGFSIDSDEAIVGLMAQHILEGKGIPTFYYGQHYMGTLEPITAAIFFKLFGQSNITLRMVPLFWTVLLLIFYFRLVRENLGSRAAKLSTALLSISPAAFIEWSTKPRGGFIEVIFLAVFALLMAFRFHRSGKICYAVLSSFILGVGWWTNNQIIYFFPAVAVIFLSGFFNAKEKSTLKFLKLFCFSLFLFLVGGLPYWLYNIFNDWVSFGMFKFANSQKVSSYFAGMLSHSLPMILGGKRFWATGDIYPFSTPIGFILYGSTAILSVLIIFFKKYSLNQRIIVLSSFLTILFTGFIFSNSQFGSLYDAPRYLLPIYISLYILVGFAGFEFCKSRISRLIFVSVFTMYHFASAYAVEMAIPGEPIVTNNQRVSKDSSELIEFLNEQKIDFVRTNYWIGYRLAFETKEKIKFKIFQTPKESRIKEYELVYKNPSSYLQLPIIAVSTQAPAIRRALKLLNATYEETIKSSYIVFYKINLSNIFENFQAIHPSNYLVEATHQNELTNYMFDNNLTTRWGSGKPQDASMKIKIKFNKQYPIKLIELSTGKYGSDFARVMQILGRSSESEEFKLLVTKEDEKSLAFFLDNESGSLVLLPGEKVNEILLHQVGRDSTFDWSIAEMNVYQ